MVKKPANINLKVDVPTYEMKIPSTGQTITIRPFIVKEEKLLLMAVESNDPLEVIKTTKQIINNCILTEGIDINKLPFFDIDYIFITLRAKSISESVEISYTCNNIIEGDTCGGDIPATIDILNVELKKNPDIKNKISVSKGFDVYMKYPNYEQMKVLTENDPNLTKKINLIATCIDKIVKGENVYTNKDLDFNQRVDFVESLTEVNFKKFVEFIDNFPSFYIKSNGKCSRCGFEHTIEYTDMSSFFE